MMYLKWRLAQLWAMNVGFRIALRQMVKSRRLRQFARTWHWWMGAWHAIEVGRLLGFPNCAYYGTDGYLRRRQVRADRRYIKDAERRRALDQREGGEGG